MARDRKSKTAEPTAHSNDGAKRQANARDPAQEFDWVAAFTPRSGLEAAATVPPLKRGSRGRRLLRL